MDVSVPSLSMNCNHLSASPQSFSIYDQERSDIHSSICGGNNSFSNQTVDIMATEECTGLDDRLENSDVRHLFTPELLNTLTASTSSFPFMQRDCKASLNNSESNTCNSLTLNEINMETDTDFMDFLNCDMGDSKFSFSVDFLNNDIKSSNSSSCHTPVPTLCVEPTMVRESHHISNDKDYLISEEESKNLNTGIEIDYFRKMVPPMKVTYPTREAQPPLIGIVAPVKKDNVLETPDMEEFKPDLHELKSSLVNKNSFEDVKYPTVSTVAYSFMDGPPQTVPSCKSLKRSHETVNFELDSPSGKKACIDASNENSWEYNTFAYNEKEYSTNRPERERHDSGGSAHLSDSTEDDYLKDDESDDDDDDYSDIDDDIKHLSTTDNESLIDTGKKQKQFFWQYNVQAKGPKGTRLKLAVDSPKDPHVLNDFEDPVFDECNTVVAGIRHGGKARKGDGNEITPNPRKLVLIGRQLLRLNKKINACQLGSDMPASKRSESRKEKNKLASRACRLKKKAQHEANKIKLHGLEEEHTQLNQVLRQIWPKLRERAKSLLENGGCEAVKNETSLTNTLSSLMLSTLTSKVANRTTDYVNQCILKVEDGDLKGGLKIRSKKT